MALVFALFATEALGAKCKVKEPKFCPSWDQKWNRDFCQCFKRNTCKMKCKPGQIQNPLEYCKCMNVKDKILMQQKWKARVQKYKGNVGVQKLFARCGGMLHKCNMYQKWNWSNCKCESRKYCKQECPKGQERHFAFYCKCVTNLVSYIPKGYKKEEGEDGCGSKYYYSEAVDACVSYAWCPAWEECKAGTKFDTLNCDCKECGNNENCPGSAGRTPVPSTNTGGQAQGASKIARILPPQAKRVTTKIAAVVQTVPNCQTGYRWDKTMGYCVEKVGSTPPCPVGQVWSDTRYNCVWDNKSCSRVKCPAGKRGYFWKSACQCFSDAAWCRLQNCGAGKFGFDFGGKCRCYTLAENCAQRTCPGNQKPQFVNGRCNCYSAEAACAARRCTGGKRGFLMGGKCACMSQTDICAKTKCKGKAQAMFWNGKCDCRGALYICSLKPCQDTRMYPQLVKNHCYCMWKKPHCSNKSCPKGMTGAWTTMKTGKNSCRCRFNEQGCKYKKCSSGKDPRWYNNQCTCMWKSAAYCKNWKCARGQVSVWSGGICKCAQKNSACDHVLCDAGKQAFLTTKNGKKKCACNKIPNWKPPAALCGDDMTWSNKYWGCINNGEACKSTEMWSRVKARCVKPDCGALQYWSNSFRRCICNAGSYWDTARRTCREIDCGIGYVYSAREGACAVDPNYRPACPSRQTWSSLAQRCVCTAGYVFSWTQRTCRPVNCGERRRWSNTAKKCYVPKCEGGKVYFASKNRCQCRRGQYWSKYGDCRTIKCKVGTMIDYETSKCVADPTWEPACGANQVYVRSRDQCECLEGTYYNEASGCTAISCTSSEKWSWKWTRCIPLACPKNMFWDDRIGKCDCTEEYFFSTRQQRCVPQFCDDGYRFSMKTETCVKYSGGSSGGSSSGGSSSGGSSKPKKECTDRQQWDARKGKCVCTKRWTKSPPAGYKGIYFSHWKCKLVRHKWCPYSKKCSSWIKKWNNKKCRCESYF